MAAFGGGGFGNQSGFGQTASAFGGSTFGNNSGAFGGQSAFGSQSNSLFGSQPQSLSVFGQSTPFAGSGVQSAPAFGSGFGGQSGSAFGSGFGQSSGTFGPSSGIGSGSGSSLFGANRPPTGAFGSSNPIAQSQSAWGQSSSAFGGATTFGSGGGLFGSSGPSNSVFGQNAGAFGAGSQGQKGTAGVSWQITTEYEGGSAQPSKYHCITMMNQFRNKSIEELRAEDYSAGNKGGAQGGAAGNPQSTGLFGNTGSAFGGSTGGLGSGSALGNTAGFGQSSSGGIFGGGGFGAPGFGQSSGGGFGSGGTFGAQSGAGIFGQSGSTVGGQSGGGFGNTGSSLFGSASGFGNPQSGGALGGAGSGFGSAQQSQPSLFGGNTQSGLFGAPAQSAGNSLFGSGGAQSTSSLFGGSTAQPNLFGSGASGFNNTGAQKSLFGSTGFGSSGAGAQPGQAQPPNSFGPSAAPPGQAFGVVPGGGNNPTLQGTFAAVTQQNGATVAPPGANYGTVLYNLQKLQSELGEHRKLLEQQEKSKVQNVPKPPGTVSVVVLPPPSLNLSGSRRRPLISGYGLSGNMSQRTTTRGVAGRIGGAAARISGTPYQSSPEVVTSEVPATPTSTTDAAPNTSATATDGVSATPASSGTTVARRMSFFSPQNFSALPPGTSLASELWTPIQAVNSPFSEGSGRHGVAGSENEQITSAASGEEQMSGMQNEHMRPNRIRRLQPDTLPAESLEEHDITRPDDTLRDTENGQVKRLSPSSQAENGSVGEPRNHMGTRRRSRSNSSEVNDANFVWAQQRPSSWSLNRPVDSDDQYNPHKYLPSQTRPGFYTVPDMADLASRTMTELQHVEDFTVGREGYGEITWIDPVDVRGLNLDAVVDIQRGEVAVFPEKEAKQLDAPARVKLEGMFTKKKKTGELTADEELNARYKQKLLNYCSRNNLRFIDYDAEKGEWVFKVQTFAD